MLSGAFGVLAWQLRVWISKPASSATTATVIVPRLLHAACGMLHVARCRLVAFSGESLFYYSSCAELCVCYRFFFLWGKVTALAVALFVCQPQPQHWKLETFLAIISSHSHILSWQIIHTHTSKDVREQDSARKREREKHSHLIFRRKLIGYATRTFISRLLQTGNDK